MAGTSMDIYSLGPILRDKVFAVAGADVRPTAERTVEAERALEPRVPLTLPTEPIPAREFPVIAIGASTGGPRALAEIVPALTRDLDAAIVVAQHMPRGFTATLAERRDERCELDVAEARDGDPLEPGKVLIAPGGMQTRVVGGPNHLVVRVTKGTSQFLHHPSVDLLFESVASSLGPRAIGLILTGMGYDGAEGLAAVKRAGGVPLAERPTTAVIAGMPKAARAAADRVVELPRIAGVLTEICAAHRAAKRERA
jgi:two-component system chemotaxis response regulator CheB